METRTTSWRTAMLGGAPLAVILLLACYASTIRGMAEQWWKDEDMGHGFAVALVAAWIIWRERQRWSAIPAQPSFWGVPILLAGAALQVASEIGGGLFVGSVGLLVSITGLIVCLGGFRRLRGWSFPLLLGLFMLPKLAFVYNQMTLPLQLLASRMAAGILTTTGYGVIREGNILDVGGHRVLVAEACSGLRYLLPLGFMSVVLAYLLDSRPWMRIALLASSVPLAIAANAVRVAVSSAVPALDSGFPHAAAGFFIFAGCLLVLALMRQLMTAMTVRSHA